MAGAARGTDRDPSPQVQAAAAAGGAAHLGRLSDNSCRKPLPSERVSVLRVSGHRSPAEPVRAGEAVPAFLTRADHLDELHQLCRASPTIMTGRPTGCSGERSARIIIY